MIVQALIIWMLLICAALGVARLAGVGRRVHQSARVATGLPSSSRSSSATAVTQRLTRPARPAPRTPASV